MYKNKNLLASVLSIVLLSFGANANYFPNAPSNNNGYDRVRTAEGTECQSQVGGALQIYGGIYDGETTNPYNYNPYNNGQIKDTGIQLGISYSIGGTKRLDCSRLYDIEVERNKLVLSRLQAEIEALKQLRDLQQKQQTGIIPNPLNLN